VEHINVCLDRIDYFDRFPDIQPAFEKIGSRKAKQERPVSRPETPDLADHIL